MGIMSHFPEYKLATVVITRQVATSYNDSGEVVWADSSIYSGKGWFYQGGDSELFENQQEKNVETFSLILDPKDLTTIPTGNDVATIDGVEGYRIGQPAKYFTGQEVLFFTVERKVGI
jgi:hypothetical protein